MESRHLLPSQPSSFSTLKTARHLGSLWLIGILTTCLVIYVWILVDTETERALATNPCFSNTELFRLHNNTWYTIRTASVRNGIWVVNGLASQYYLANTCIGSNASLVGRSFLDSLNESCISTMHDSNLFRTDDNINHLVIVLKHLNIVIIIFFGMFILSFIVFASSHIWIFNITNRTTQHTDKLHIINHLLCAFTIISIITLQPVIVALVWYSRVYINAINSWLYESSTAKPFIDNNTLRIILTIVIGFNLLLICFELGIHWNKTRKHINNAQYNFGPLFIRQH